MHLSADYDLDTTDALILVLGHKNDPQGELSSIAKQRCLAACELYYITNQPVVCTGGKHPKFNQGNQNHAHYLQAFMQSNGVPGQAFIDHAPSLNTYEDGKLSAAILGKFKVKIIHLVTSDFHIKRAFLWQKKFSPQCQIQCYPARTIAPENEIQQLHQHEKNAINQFYRDFPDFPSIEQFEDWIAYQRSTLNG